MRFWAKFKKGSYKRPKRWNNDLRRVPAVILIRNLHCFDFYIPKSAPNLWLLVWYQLVCTQVSHNLVLGPGSTDIQKHFEPRFQEANASPPKPSEPQQWNNLGCINPHGSECFLRIPQTFILKLEVCWENLGATIWFLKKVGRAPRSRHFPALAAEQRSLHDGRDSSPFLGPISLLQFVTT